MSECAQLFGHAPDAGAPELAGILEARFLHDARAMDLVWDRGTLLLRGATDKQVADVAGLLWDPRVSAWRAPGALHRQLLRDLRGRGLAVRDCVVPERAAPQALEPPGLRPYQSLALAAWETGQRRGVVVLPTGAGKTRVAIAAMARTGGRTLCLVPTRVLLDQWCDVLAASGALRVGRYGDGERTLGDITVATFKSALLHAEDVGNRFALLVVDEAHHFGGGAGDEALEMCTAPWRLGLTATPVADDTKRARLDRLIGPVVYGCSIEELAGTFLAPVEIVTLSLPLSEREQRRYDAECDQWRPLVRQFFRTAPGASWTDFVRAAGRTDEGRRALAAWRRSRALVRWPEPKRVAVNELLRKHATARTLVFAPDAVTAYALSRETLIPAITADISRTERARVLEAFARGDLRAIASARVLNEGVDVPSADVAIIVGGSQGDREYVQRVGRVLRPAPGKRAIVYELVTPDTHEVRESARMRRQLGLR